MSKEELELIRQVIFGIVICFAALVVGCTASSIVKSAHQCEQPEKQ